MKLKTFRQIRAANVLHCRASDTATLVNWINAADRMNLSNFTPSRNVVLMRSIIRGTRREIHRRINKQGMKAVYGR